MDERYSIDLEDGRMVEVMRDDHGHHWVGMTVIHDPRDWEFHPRDQYGTGEVGERTAIAAARLWADGIIADRRWTK